LKTLFATEIALSGEGHCIGYEKHILD